VYSFDNRQNRSLLIGGRREYEVELAVSVVEVWNADVAIQRWLADLNEIKTYPLKWLSSWVLMIRLSINLLLHLG